MNYELSGLAREYAVGCHADVNQRYGGNPYSYHLQFVFDTGMRYINLIPEDAQDIVLAACWCHDLIEDARQTYNDVKKVVGYDVAEIVFALTNEKGRYRHDRANDKYYEDIRNTPYADFVKLCDRLANVENCVVTKNRMLEMYQKENERFTKKLYNVKYESMFNDLADLLSIQHTN